MKRTVRRHSALLWQVLLIFPPVVLLSAVALYSLRQDKAMVEQEARDRCGIVASSVTRQWERRAGASLADFYQSYILDRCVTLELAAPAGENTGDAGSGTGSESRPEPNRRNRLPDDLPQLQGSILDGRIRRPLDYPSLPTPPDWPARLGSQQAEIWRTAEQILYGRVDRPAEERLKSAMKSAALPEEARANLEFVLLVAESRRDKSPQNARQLMDLARRYPEARTEAGTPLADLATIQALRLSVGRPVPDTVRQELVRLVIGHPSFMTPELLAAAEQAARLLPLLESIWREQQRTRVLLGDLLRRPMNPKGPTEVWLESGAHHILAQCFPEASREARVGPPETGGRYEVTLVPAETLERAFAAALTGTRDQIPAYAGVSVEVGGREWSVTADARTGGPELGSASGLIEVASSIPAACGAVPEMRMPYLDSPMRLALPFKISLRLARADLLYAGYRRRLWLAAALVVTSLAATLVGLAGAWRAYQRQIRLGEMKSDFVSSVSHELRAPIASVRLMAENLERGKLDSEQKRKEYFGLMVQECRRLASLVENVLDFSRIDRGSKQYEFEPTDLRALVRQTVRLMEPGGESRQVRLVLTEPPCVDMQPCCDGRALQQALVNLIDNAIKHAPAGTTVDICLEFSGSEPGSQLPDGTPSQGMARIWVEDRGPGIPADEQKKIFEPFYRRGSELRRETQGIGIGLSIVKHVVAAHSGRVLVHSAAGQGSRFTMEIPC